MLKLAQPLRWLAPESHKSKSPKYNFKTDAWSYGITVWEMYSRGTTIDYVRPHVMVHSVDTLCFYHIIRYFMSPQGVADAKNDPTSKM